MENYQNDNRSESSLKDDWQEREFRKGPMAGVRKAYKDSSPEEVKAAVKEQVSKGVAAAAGAVEGLADEMENDNLPETAERAIGLVGKTTRTIARTTLDEARKTKQAIQGGLSGTTKEQDDDLDLQRSPDVGLGDSSVGSLNQDLYKGSLDTDLDEQKPGF